MTTQDADDSDSDASANERKERVDNAEEGRPDGESGTASADETQSEPSAQPEDVEQFLTQLAEAPDDGVDAVLADIIAGGETADDESEEPTAADGPAETEQPVDPSEITVSEELLEELTETPTERLARTLAVMREEIDRLEQQVSEYSEEAEDLESRLARKQADFQNYKKRQKQRLEDEKQRATEDLVGRLLDVRDNLARALEQDEGADIRGGVESTLEQFDQQLDRENVERIEPRVGDDTDPHRHEVLATIASEQPEGTVAQIHRPGYLMGEKVLRPAQVAVSDGSLAENE